MPDYGGCYGWLMWAVAMGSCGCDLWERSRTQADLDGIKKEFPTAVTICVDLRDADKVKVRRPTAPPDDPPPPRPAHAAPPSNPRLRKPPIHAHHCTYIAAATRHTM